MCYKWSSFFPLYYRSYFILSIANQSKTQIRSNKMVFHSLWCAPKIDTNAHINMCDIYYGCIVELLFLCLCALYHECWVFSLCVQLNKLRQNGHRQFNALCLRPMRMRGKKAIDSCCIMYIPKKCKQTVRIGEQQNQ